MLEAHTDKWLFIDAGNSRIKAAKSVSASVEMLGEIVDPQTLGDVINDVDAILVSSVGQSAWLRQLEVMLAEHAKPLFQVQVKKSFLGIENMYQNVEQMGCDRWLAVLGAASLTELPFVIVDFGTAINVEFVDQQRNYLGGWIAPGLRLMCEALFKGTDRVKGQLGGEVELIPGKNTQQAVDAGCMAAAAGILRQATEQVQKLGDISVVFACGGDYPKIKHISDPKVRHEEGLVFLGMQKYATGIPLKSGQTTIKMQQL
ncbi:type III pantothenate kinase [Bowmanella pacifica]|uniref:Type III pantothenate kinase n=1 Tax=Bowmanella pacifica TaxID=502051 RepID=A0A917Z7L6_9ALTE|nr:type III pantothenate kinase [Bowmanella pacifica]GGO75324.1 type III pantothenate kinase [Bowmanella pacifica]